MIIKIQLPYHEDSYMIETDCDEMGQALKQLFGVYCTDDIGKPDIVITHAGTGYRMLYDSLDITTSDPMGLLHNLMFSQKKITPGIFAFHAGGVCHNGKAYVFCAPTTTGKTTLTAYLTACGMSYISDDCVFIGMNDLAVYPCHNPIHLREGGYSVLCQKNLTPVEAVFVDDRYVYTPRNLSPLQMTLGGIFFVKRTDQENRIRIPGKAEVLQNLMLSPITAYPLTKDYLAFLQKLIPYCTEIHYSDMDFVSEQIINK